MAKKKTTRKPKKKPDVPKEPDSIKKQAKPAVTASSLESGAGKRGKTKENSARVEKKLEDSKQKKDIKKGKESPGIGEKLQSWKDLQKRKWRKFKKRAKRTLSVRWLAMKNWFWGERDRKYVETSYIGKKFIGLIAFFALYSFIFVLFSKNQGSTFFHYMVLGDGYTFGVSIVFFFLALSFLLSVDRIRDFIFQERTAIKQLGVFGILFAGIFVLAKRYVSAGFNFMPILTIFATLWLIFLSVNYFTMARSFSTKVEKNFVNKYSKFRLGVASFVPWVIVIALVFISWMYRYALVIGTLDIISQTNPEGAANLYSFLTRITIPAIYISLVVSTIFMIMEFFITRSKSETRSSGVFDNLTFSLIVLFLYGYLILQITLYTVVNPQNTAAFQGVSKTSSAALFSTILVLLEFGLSMFFLYRGVRGMTKRFSGKLLFYKRDGLVLILLACVLSQSVSRYITLSDIVTEAGVFETFLRSNRLIISLLLIIFLGVTVIFYYLSPQQSSMFMRIEKEAVETEERVQSLVLKFLRREFIRKGKKFTVDSVIGRLLEITNLPPGVIHSMIHRIADSYVDIILEVVKKDDGSREKWIDFIPVTERYDSDKTSEERAKQFLTDAFSKTIQAKKEQKTRISIGRKRPVKRDSAVGNLISSLEASYRKKRKIESEREEKQEELTAKVEDLTKIDLAEDTVDILYEILKNEYIKRVKKTDDYSRISFRVMEIIQKIELLTKISPADLFPALEVLKVKEKNIRVKSYDQDRDRLIEFYPISDLEVSDLVELYRPAHFKKLQKILWRQLIDALHFEHRGVMEETPLFTELNEVSGASSLVEHLLQVLNAYFPKSERYRKWQHAKYSKLQEILELLDKTKKGDKRFDVVVNRVLVKPVAERSEPQK
ncbi:MAG: hypothetical protein ACTSU5_16880 [Promethearchaeota archaeon]